MKLSAVLLAASASAQCTFEDSTVTCDGSGLTIDVPKCFFEENNLDPYSAHVNNGTEDGCSYTNGTDTLTWSLPPSGLCGTSYEQVNGTHLVYSNAITASEGDSDGTISRARSAEVDFACSYEIEQEVSSDDKFSSQDKKEFDLGDFVGTYDVAMGLYTDNNFNVSVAADYAPHVPEFVNVKVNLVGAADNLVLQVKECFATPSAQSNDTTSYTFIEEYCAVDTTIADLVNAASDDATFSIEAFSFNGDHLGNEVFFHCDVHICDDEQGECGKTCNGRKKRSVNENGQQAQRMTVGPIEVVQTAHNQRLV